jgi:hypothetical protein
MKFVAKRKCGQNRKVRRMWMSVEGYRIIWRKEAFGIRVPARYQACVRVLVPCNGGQLFEAWDFVDRKRRLHKTLKAAQEECEKHFDQWSKVTGVRSLKEIFGKLPVGLPCWARKTLDRHVYAILTNYTPAKRKRFTLAEESTA